MNCRKEKITSNDGTVINAEVVGEGPDLLFLNGMRATLPCWKRQVGVLKQKFRCINYDHRGVGESGKPDKAYTAKDHHDDIQALFNHFEVDQAVLIGHSMGGMRALDFTISNQSKVNGLVLINSGAHVNMSLKLMMRTTLKAIEAKDQKLLDAMNEIGLAITFGEKSLSELEPRFGDFVKSSFAGVTLDSAKNLYRGMLADEQDFRDKLTDIQVPTLVIAGDEDLQFPAKHSENIHNLIPNSSYKLLADCGHFALSEKPKELNQLLAEFLSTLAQN